MFQFSQQFSATAKSQLEAHLRLVDDLAARAFDSAEKVIALQFSASRAVLDNGAALAQQVFSLKRGEPPADAVRSPEPQTFADSAPAATPAAASVAAVTAEPEQTESTKPAEPATVAAASIAEAAPPDAPAEVAEAAAVSASAVTPVAQAVAELTEAAAPAPAAAPVEQPKPIEVTTLKPAQEAPQPKASRAKGDVPLKSKPASGAPKPGGGQARK